MHEIVLKNDQKLFYSLGLILICFPLILYGCNESGTLKENEITKEVIRETVEGTWVLQSWNLGDRIITPPEAHGFIQLKNGIWLFTIYRTSGDTTFTRFGNAVYEITDSTWAYRYDHNFYIVTVGVNNDTVLETDYFSWDEPWLYHARIENGQFKIVHSDGNRYMIYDGDDQTYVEFGRMKRTWKRIRAN